MGKEELEKELKRLMDMLEKNDMIADHYHWMFVIGEALPYVRNGEKQALTDMGV